MGKQVCHEWDQLCRKQAQEMCSPLRLIHLDCSLLKKQKCHRYQFLSITQSSTFRLSILLSILRTTVIKRKHRRSMTYLSFLRSLLNLFSIKISNRSGFDYTLCRSKSNALGRMLLYDFVSSRSPVRTRF